jgi:hypothetical protein
MHYQGGRDDSEFWRYIKTGATMTPFVEETLERLKTRIPTYLHYEDFWGSSASLWGWINAGLGFATPKIAKKELKLFEREAAAESIFKYHSDGFAHVEFQEELFSIITRNV